MGRSWNRYDASLEDIKRCRKAILSKFSNATDIYFDEYLVDTHRNESCNANKFYYGAVLETKDGRFQAATSYGRIGEHLDSQRAFGGIKAFDEGVFTNFDSAKRKLNEKLDKKKRGKRCSKCKTRQSYSPFAPKNAEEYGAEDWQTNDAFWEYMYLNYGEKFDDNGYIEMTNSELRKIAKKQGFAADYTKGYTDTTQKIQYNDKYGQPKESIVQGLSGYAGNCPSCSKRINFPIDNSGLYCYDCQVYLLPSKGTGMDKTLQYDAETMSPQVFGKLVGQYPQPPNNPLPVGGFMDEGFEWTVNQAETFNSSSIFEDHHNLYRLEIKRNTNRGWELLRVWKNEQDAINNYYDIYLDYPEVRLLEVDEDGDSENIMIQRNVNLQKEEFGSSNIVSKVKNNWLNGLVGLGLGLVAFDFVKKKGYVANADTLIESPNTGDLTPADYEEIVVESTGYAVPIIPVSLDGSFMGSRFHALPTDRYVYDSPEGIGAHSDVAMKRNTTFLPNEMSLVQASEAPGQSPYNSILPNGQENKDFPLRVIHETTTVSLDPSTAPFIPTDMSGYTGQQFIPTSVYEDMLGVGISGKIPSFSQPASGDIGSNHFGSRIANPDMLTNVGGPLQEDVNGDYTDGSITKSLSQWSIENQVQQISDTEAIVVERGSGGRKMIRRV